MPSSVSWILDSRSDVLVLSLRVSNKTTLPSTSTFTSTTTGGQDCTTENPFDSITPYADEVRESINTINLFVKTIGDFGMEEVTTHCGTDISPVVDNVLILLDSLKRVQTSMQTALRLVDCSSIVPIIRRIFRGSTCHESVTGLAWMFGTLFAVACLGMAVLSVRAALYNATFPYRRRHKQRDTEKEWEEYKEYMERFYDDAPMWKFQPTPEKHKPPMPMIGGAPSYDTGITSNPSSTDSWSDEHGNQSHLHVRRLSPSVKDCHDHHNKEIRRQRHDNDESSSGNDSGSYSSDDSSCMSSDDSDDGRGGIGPSRDRDGLPRGGDGIFRTPQPRATPSRLPRFRVDPIVPEGEYPRGPSCIHALRRLYGDNDEVNHDDYEDDEDDVDVDDHHNEAEPLSPPPVVPILPVAPKKPFQHLRRTRRARDLTI